MDEPLFLFNKEELVNKEYVKEMTPKVRIFLEEYMRNQKDMFVNKENKLSEITNNQLKDNFENKQKSGKEDSDYELLDKNIFDDAFNFNDEYDDY
ncbi:hypothetical protein TRFO_14480 [Tritrichomonas foetus]|uniref:Uncharacterized protein n=1 Tax=Tritrichomonas foetus TaxID=1144522 RepID=A0A1J4KZI5_9EUKA|nr:hypothetical protein TRFO_14480 [Tritrichomonas foetus]|eukprot:OHT15118.1 hypothetical protein TRFO_14480 [Tritrichomonas foetus]